MSSSHQNNGEPAQAQAVAHNYETTFDVDGNVETRSTSSQGNKDDTRSQRSVGSISRDGNRYVPTVYRSIRCWISVCFSY